MNKNAILGLIVVTGLALVYLVDMLQPKGEEAIHIHDTVIPAPPARQTTPMTAPLGRGVGKGNLGSMDVTVPAEWVVESPSSSMRIAQYNLPGKTSGNAEMAVFNKIGGSVEQNIERWIGQFTQPDGSSSDSKAELTQFVIGSLRADRIYLEGTYSAGAMGGSPAQQTGYCLLGYIVIMPDGPYYFKTVGPVETIKQYETSIDQFIKNIKVAG